MNKTKTRKYLAFVIALLLFMTVFTPMKTSADGEVRSGTVSIPSAQGTKDETFYFSDAWFGAPSGTENPSLATTSMLMALSSVPVKADGYEAQSKNVSAFMEKLGLSDIQVNPDYKEKMKTDSMGVAVGKKELKSGDESFTLLAVALRSGNYEKEWGGNFNVGADGLHKGFETACDHAAGFLAKYIADQGISGRVKVWVSGHSRGGAVANLLGHFLSEKAASAFKEGGADVTITPDDVYAYTFGTPNTTPDSASSAKGIFNYLSSDDPFTLLPLASWGFTKYGKTIDLDDGKAPEGFSAATWLKQQLSAVRSDRADYAKRIEPVLKDLFATASDEHINPVIVASILMLTDTSGEEFTDAKVDEILGRARLMMNQFGLADSVLSSHGGDAILAKLRAKDPLYSSSPGGEDDPSVIRFSDVPEGAWFEKTVQWAASSGYVKGTAEGTFEPATAVSRGMVATILYSIAGKPPVEGTSSFTDVQDGAWYSAGVAFAQASGFVKGYDDKTFRPLQNITREELATILYSYVKSQGKGFGGTWMFALEAPDASSISGWANEAMHFMVMSGIMKGDESKMLRPTDTCSRAEAVTMLYQLMHLK